MKGPDPTYQPEFPEEFIQQAQEIVSRPSSTHQHWQRAQMVLLFVENPKRSSPEVAEEVGLDKSSARRWRKRWCDGDFSLEDKPRSGRPNRLDSL